MYVQNGVLGVQGTNPIELGVGVAGKETSAGRIGYQTCTGNALDIVGAGTGLNRRIKLWDHVTIGGALTVSGSHSITLTYAYLSSGGNGFAQGTNNYSIFTNERIAASEFNAYSDGRRKDDIEDISDDVCLSAGVAKLRPRVYRRKNSDGSKGTHTIGFVAQEAKDAVPQAVQVMPLDGVEDFHTLDYNQILSTAIGAIKALAARVEQLEKGLLLNNNVVRGV
jgi:hypothetical protein